MQNRREYHVPEIYVEWPALTYGNQDIPSQPVPLDVFQVTYLHYHRHLELGYCVRGFSRSYVEDRVEECGPGDITLVFPFQRHISCNAEKEFALWKWVYIDPISLFTQSGIGDISAVNKIICNEMGICGVLNRKTDPAVAQQAIQLMENAFRLRGQRHAQERFALSVYSFLLTLSDASANLPKLPMHTDQKLTFIKPALEAINDSLDRETIPSVEMLSETCHMCASNFRHVFHEVVGISPKEYITMACMRKATLLLSITNIRVMEIAMHCGFREISSFNRCFAKNTGMTPSNYRRRYSGVEVPASTGGKLPSGARAYGE